jgi:hypothetical protein
MGAPVTVTLAVAIDAILDALVAYLEAETGDDGCLCDVVVVQRGDRDEPRPEEPAVYVTPQRMRISEGITTSLVEWWELPVELHAVVSDETPATGYAEATDLAARARSVLLTHSSKNLGLAYVRGVHSGEFDVSGPWSRNGDYYRAMAELKILFSVRG